MYKYQVSSSHVIFNDAPHARRKVFLIYGASRSSTREISTMEGAVGGVGEGVSVVNNALSVHMSYCRGRFWKYFHVVHCLSDIKSFAAASFFGIFYFFIVNPFPLYPEIPSFL